MVSTTGALTNLIYKEKNGNALKSVQKGHSNASKQPRHPDEVVACSVFNLNAKRVFISRNFPKCCGIAGCAGAAQSAAWGCSSITEKFVRS